MVFISTEKQMKYIALLILILFNFDSSAAQCLKFSSTFTNESSGQAYVVHFADQYQVSDCPFDGLLTSQELARFNLYEEQNGALSEITAENSTIAFTFGMSGYLLFWFIGYKGRMAKQAIKAV